MTGRDTSDAKNAKAAESEGKEGKIAPGTKRKKKIAGKKGPGRKISPKKHLTKASPADYLTRPWDLRKRKKRDT